MESKKKDQKLQFAIFRHYVNLFLGGSILVAVLAGNNDIQDFVNNNIKQYINIGSNVISFLVFVVLISILGVFVATQLSQLITALEKQKDNGL